MWVRTALFTSLTSYRSWLIELVRVTARRLGLPVTLLGGAPDPYDDQIRDTHAFLIPIASLN